MEAKVHMYFLFLLGLLVLGATAYGQHTYVFYYSRASGQDVVVNLLNISKKDSHYKLQIFDAWGKLLWEIENDLAPKDAAFYLISEYVSEDTGNWGIAQVKSTEKMVIAVEYYLNKSLLTIDAISQELFLSESENGSYVVCVYHTEVPGTSTALILMNPLPKEVKGRLNIYKSDGTKIFQDSFTLAPFEAKFFNLLKIVEADTHMWGLLEIFAEAPVAVACKYFVGEAISVRNTLGKYISEEGPLVPQGVPKGEGVPQKED